MAMLPADYMNAVVSVGKWDGGYWELGTGFLAKFGIFEHQGTDLSIWMVLSNVHVAKERVTHIKFAPREGESPEVVPLYEMTKDPWITDPEGADVAGIWIPADCALVAQRTYECTWLGVGTPTLDEIDGIAEGDGVFIIGFPDIGQRPLDFNPVVRGGVISQFQNYRRGASETFLIDAPAYPGNSGGPVIVRPQALALEGTQRTTNAYLMGVVTAYVGVELEEGAEPSHTGLTVAVGLRAVHRVAKILGDTVLDRIGGPAERRTMLDRVRMSGKGKD